MLLYCGISQKSWGGMGWLSYVFNLFLISSVDWGAEFFCLEPYFALFLYWFFGMCSENLKLSFFSKHYSTFWKCILLRWVNNYPHCIYKIYYNKDIIFQHSPLTFQWIWSSIAWASLCHQNRILFAERRSIHAPLVSFLVCGQSTVS